jgi:tripartite ATP-independent transporter DctP family solute receptor
MNKMMVNVLAFSVAALFASGVAQAQVNAHTFRLSTAGATGHPSIAGGEKFGELVSQKSGGKMTVKVFAAGVLGGDVQALSAVQGGTIDFTVMNSGILQTQVKEFAIFDFPFMFLSGKQADAVLDGPFGKKMADMLPPKGLVNLAYWELGFRQLTNSKRSIKSADDINGLKIRVIQSPIYLDTWSALGANPVPMPFTEVYTALEQKVIDGQENPFSVILTSKLNEVQKFIGITNHMYNPQSLLMSKKVWDKLTKDEQKILTDAAKEATAVERKYARDAADQAIVELKKTVEVTPLPPTEIAKIQAKLKPVIDKYSANVGPDLVKELQAELAKAPQ